MVRIYGAVGAENPVRKNGQDDKGDHEEAYGVVDLHLAEPAFGESVDAPLGGKQHDGHDGQAKCELRVSPNECPKGVGEGQCDFCSGADVLDRCAHVGDDAIRFFVIAFVVLPVLPDRVLGPYGTINPYHIWVLVVAMTGISWLGYIAVRLVGASKGTLVAGFAGGFISASATTASMGAASRQPGARKGVLLAGAIGASVATPVQLFLVLGVASPKVLSAMVAPLAAAFGFLVAEGALIYYLTRDANQDSDRAPASRRPFSLAPALILAALITLVLVVSRWGAEEFGAAGTVFTTALAGFADAHAPVLSAASLVTAGSLSEHVAILAGSAALLTNTVTKAILAFVSGGVRFGVPFAVLMTPPVAGFAIALFATGASA